MKEHLISNLWYTIAAITDCDVETHNGVTIHLPAGIQYFHFADADSIYISGQYKLTQNPPLFKPAAAAALGGGYIESNLHIGHAAAVAVAAQCTLTLDDLATGGTLEDSNGQRVELENPHKYAEGYLAFRDATEACTLAIGEWSKSWDEMKDAKASGTFPVMGDEGTISVSGIQVSIPNDPADDAAWNAAFSAAECGIVCTAVDQHGEIDVSVEAAEVGEAGNCIVISVENYEPVTLAGGSTARTKQDVVDAIASDADCPVNATLDADEAAISLTAKEFGEDYDVNAEGDMFSNWSDVEGGHGDYTVAELITAIGGGFDDITPAAGEAEGAITLTANTAGAAANAITYTATGCFGGGTVKQGSTTRGKNAVAQTDYEIILNGNQPRQLTPTTQMRNGGVYTVAADTDARLITLPANATATIVVSSKDGDMPTVQLPAWKWCTENALPPVLGNEFFRVFRFEVANDGFFTSARLVSTYQTDWPYTAMTSDTATTGDITFVRDETSQLVNGYQGFNHQRDYYKPCQIKKSSSETDTVKNMDGVALEPVEIEGEEYQYRITLQLAAPHKFTKIGFGLFREYSGTVRVIVQAKNGEDWVTVSGVTKHEGTGTSKRLWYLVNIYDTAPTTDKWRFVIQNIRTGTLDITHHVSFSDFRFFES
ncbi:MAG: hypothetical protein MJ056_02930 [Akkermansia sp.]|nr:hypothetical protein [Akkermansia sp.]